MPHFKIQNMHLPENQDILDKYVEYLIEERNVGSAVTISRYSAELKTYEEWLIKQGVTDIKDGNNPDLITAYVEIDRKAGNSTSTISFKVSILKAFYKFMYLTEITDKEFHGPKLLRKGAYDKREILVPTAKQIFMMRTKKYQTIQAVLAFELLLSTGLRIGELLQIRMCDINPREHPYDIDLKSDNLKFKASIKLHKKQNHLKGNITRHVFVGQSAYRMILYWMRENNLSFDQDVPLLPFGETTVRHWIYDIGNGVISKANDVPAGKLYREDNFGDITIQQINDIQSVKIRKMIMNRVSQGMNTGPKRVKRKISPKNHYTDDRKMHPHSLRHTFAALMLYRNYFGERGNGIRLSQIMGHTAQETKYQYLSQMGVCENDSQWERLFYGRPNDWPGLRRSII